MIFTFWNPYIILQTTPNSAWYFFHKQVRCCPWVLHTSRHHSRVKILPRQCPQSWVTPLSRGMPRSPLIGCLQHYKGRQHYSSVPDELWHKSRHGRGCIKRREVLRLQAVSSQPENLLDVILTNGPSSFCLSSPSLLNTHFFYWIFVVLLGIIRQYRNHGESIKMFVSWNYQNPVRCKSATSNFSLLLCPVSDYEYWRHKSNLECKHISFRYERSKHKKLMNFYGNHF